MPAIGEQHNNAPTNPFEEVKPRISEYTAIQIATLQSRLQKQLGPEYISTRKGPGGKNVHYIASEKVIGLANDVFGFNGWSSTIRDIQVDFVDENVQTHKIDIGLSVIVRVTLQDGTFHEDIGYGHMENCSGKAAAFEKAKKEGTTDAMKRALRNFGNVLGNCVYDKDYLSKVTKLKAKPVKFDENNLHRHRDYAIQAQPVEQERPLPNPAIAAVQAVESNEEQAVSRASSVRGDAEDEFGSADFDAADFSFADLDHPDEVLLDQPKAAAPAQHTYTNQQQANVSRPPGPATTTRPQSVPQNQTAQRPQMNGAQQQSAHARPQANYHTNQSRPPGAQGQAGSVRPAQAINAQPQSYGARPGNAQMQPPRPAPQQAPPVSAPPGPMEQPIPPGMPTGFLSAKAAADLAQLPPGAAAPLPQFNPRAESPSIRKTAGVDHSKSMGIKRAVVLGPDPVGPVPGRPMQPDMGRRIGAPQAMASPLANRGQFKPVATVGKRSADGMGAGIVPRSALNDVTATSINAPTAPQGPDPKRPRYDNEQQAAARGT